MLASAWRIGLATFSERFRWLDVSGASKPSDLLRWTNLAPLRRGSVRRVGLPGWYNKFPIRDHTMVLVAYGHGSAPPSGDLQWHQEFELTTGRLYVHRAKNGSPSVQSGRRDTCPPAPAAGAGGIPARLLVRTGWPDDPEGLSCPIRPYRIAGQDALPGAFAHAAAWLRVRPGTRAGGLAWNCHILPTNTRLKGGSTTGSIPDAARPC